MCLDGLRGDIELCGDFFVAQSLCQKLKKFGFTLGENRYESLAGRT